MHPRQKETSIPEMTFSNLASSVIVAKIMILLNI